MSVTKQNIIDRSVQLATNVAGDANESKLVDAEVTADVAFPHALRYVFEKIAKSGIGIEDLIRVHNIEIAGDAPDGQGSLPDGIYKEYLDRSYLPEVRFSSKLPLPDYGRFRFDNQMCYFAIQEGQIHYSCDTRDINRKNENGSIDLEDTLLAIESESLTSADIGRRVRFVKADGTLLIDSFIDSVTNSGQAVLRGKALEQADPFNPTITIYETPATETTEKSITAGIDTVENSDIVTSSSLVPIFDSTDEGRRFTAGIYPQYATGKLTVVDGTNVFASGYLTISLATGNSTGSLTIRQGVAATGFYIMNSTIVSGNSITLANKNIYFGAGPPGNQIIVPLVSTATAQMVALVQSLNAFVASNPTHALASATYSSRGNRFFIQYKTLGTAGNSYTLLSNNVNIVPNTSTLTGGINGLQSGEYHYVNGYQCIWSNGTSTASTVYVGEPEDSAEDNVVNLANALNSAPITDLDKASYTPNGNSLTIDHIEPGAIGNLFAIDASNLGAIAPSGANLTGGTGGIVEGETITIGNSGGVVFTLSRYQECTASNTILPYSSNGDPVESADLIAEALNLKTDVKVSVSTYTPSLPSGTSTSDTEIARAIHIVYDTVGAGGNNFGLGNSVPPSGFGITGSGIARSASTLLGGVTGNITTNETISVAGVPFIFHNVSIGDSFIPFDVGGNRNTNAQLIATHLTNVTGSYPALANAVFANNGPDVIINSTLTGTAGEAFLLADSSSGHVTASGAHLVLEDATIAVDSFIEEYIDATSVRLRAKAVSTQSLCDATVSFVPLKFAAVSQATSLALVTADADLGLPLKVTDEIVATIAAVLRGEIKLKELAEDGIA